MSNYTEDHLVERPATQLMLHELGWDVVNCYDEWNGGVSNQGRDGKREGGKNIEHRTPNIEHRSEEKRKRRPALHRLNPDLPVEAIEGAVEERGVLDDEFWIWNGRGRRLATRRLNPVLRMAEAAREIDSLVRAMRWVLFALKPDRLCNRLRMSEFLFEWKTSE